MGVGEADEVGVGDGDPSGEALGLGEGDDVADTTGAARTQAAANPIIPSAGRRCLAVSITIDNGRRFPRLLGLVEQKPRKIPTMPIDAQGRTVSDDGRYWLSGSQWLPVEAPAFVHTSSAPTYDVRIISTNGLAIASAITGGLAWFVCPFVGAIAAVVMGFMAKSEIRRTHEAGWGWASAGQILGFAHLVVYGFIALFFFVVFGGLSVLGAIGSGGH
jgi:hypothetical protein